MPPQSNADTFLKVYLDQGMKESAYDFLWLVESDHLLLIHQESVSFNMQFR